MTHGGNVGPERNAAQIVEPAVSGLSREIAQGRNEPGDDPLSIGLSDGAEAHAGRNEIARKGDEKGLERGVKADTVPRCSSADSNRIGDILRRTRKRFDGRARPGGAQGHNEGIALRQRFEVTFACRRERQRKVVHLDERGAIAAPRRAPGGGDDQGVVVQGPERHEICEPGRETCRVMDVLGLDGSFEPVAIGEGADRKGRRKPDEQRQRRATLAGQGRVMIDWAGIM